MARKKPAKRTPKKPVEAAPGDEKKGNEISKDRLAAELASGVPIALAATACNIPLTTAYNWKREAGFSERIAAFTTEHRSQGQRFLSGNLVTNLQKLQTLADSDDPKIQLAALKLLLPMETLYFDAVELVERVRVLEEAKEAAGQEGKAALE